MSRIRSRIRLPVLVISLFLAPSVHAQQEIEGLIESASASLESAKARLKALEESERDTDKSWNQPVQERIRLLTEWLAVQKNVADLQSGANDAIPTRTKAAEERLAAARALAPPKSVPIGSTDELTAYEKSSTEAANEVEQRNKELSDLTARIRSSTEALKSLPARETACKQRIDSLTAADELSRYRVLSSRLELRVLTEQSKYHSAVVESATKLRPVVQKELDAATLRAAHSNAEVKLARAVVTEIRQSEAKEIQAQAETQRRLAKRALDPIVRFQVKTDADNKEAQARIETLRTEITDLRNTESAARLELTGIAEERAYIHERLRSGTQGTAAILRKAAARNRQRLAVLDERGGRMARAYAANQSQLVAIQDRIYDLKLDSTQSTDAVRLLSELGPERREEALRTLRSSRDDTLEVLQTEKTEREAIEAAHRKIGLTDGKIRGAIGELGLYIRDQLHWTRSHPPIDFGTFAAAAAELPLIAERIRDPAILHGENRSIRERSPIEAALFVLILISFAALILIAPLVRRRRTSDDPGEPTTPGSRSGVLTILRVALFAAIPGVALLLAGVILRLFGYATTLPDRFLEPAALFFLWRLSKCLFAATGVSVQIFEVPVEAAEQLHRFVRLAVIAGIFFLWPGHVLEAEPFGLQEIPQILETVAHTLFVVALARLLSVRGALRKWLTNPGSLGRKCWLLVAPFLILGFFATLAMAVLGYRIGAQFVLQNALLSIGAVMLLLMMYALLVRGVSAIATHVRKRMLHEEDARTAWGSWEQVKGQLTRLVAVLVLSLAVIAMLTFWGTGALLIDALESMRIIEVRPDDWLTAYDILIAIVWIAGGHFVIHNLSAIYEFLIVPLAGQGTKGGRFVVLTLARYGIYLAVYSAALITVGFDYSKLAWLATALSVGIGFGLQEIVANFVSGLIILLERPIRVGDLVSVAGMEGTVDRISMRATTVINWDKQVIIIPNKDFITKELTNWTRADDVMRRKLFVGVAYGSDVDQVTALILDEVKGHAKVLDDPAPRVFFSGLGESSLDFEIWIYARIEDGLNTRSQLYDRIYGRFNREGIVIPFPQRDLHIISQGPSGQTPRQEARPAREELGAAD